jgi:solute carrier family 25 (adenine nucleotide translocator) protein 4/5/6/31
MSDSALDFGKNFLLGGVSGAIAKTCTAPIERVKLIIQTQDSNTRILSGEVRRYSGNIY